MKKILSLMLSAVVSAVAAFASGHEMRGVWVATVWGIDWPSQQGSSAKVIEAQQASLAELLDMCEEMNLTTVFFQVRSMCDAMYRSEREPWSRFISGSRGKDPGWDPLEWVVRECHERGLECYAWVNPFRIVTGNQATTGFDREVARRGWLLSHGGYTVLNPGIEEVRDHIVAVCRDIVTGYEVDGLVFDDYFYPNRIPADSSAPDYKLYRSTGSMMEMGQWRRACVHKLVADVSAMIFDERPDVRFGISPAGVAGRGDTSARHWGVTPVEVKAADWQWTDIYSDPLGWLYQGTVDFVSPQLYWPTHHATAPYMPLARWWDYAAMCHGRHAWPSITLADLEGGTKREKVDDHLRQLKATDEHCSPGIVFYSAKFLPQIRDAIEKSGRFASKTISPAASWKYPHDYPAVKGLRIKGSRLKWDAVKPSYPGAIVRYAVYAFPSKLDPSEIVEEPDGHISDDYLLGLTYEPSFAIASGATRGMTLAVTVVDGNSVEHPAAFLKR